MNVDERSFGAPYSRTSSRTVLDGSIIGTFCNRLMDVYWDPTRMFHFLVWLNSNCETLKRSIAQQPQPDRQGLYEEIVERREVLRTNVETSTFSENPGLITEYWKLHFLLNDIIYVATAKNNQVDAKNSDLSAQSGPAAKQESETERQSRNPILDCVNEYPTREFYRWLDDIYWDPTRIPNFMAWLKLNTEMIEFDIAQKPTPLVNILVSEIVTRRDVVRENIQTGPFSEDFKLNDAYLKLENILNSMINSLLSQSSSGGTRGTNPSLVRFSPFELPHMFAA